MTQEDIIRMAREAHVYCTTRQPTLDAMLERFAALVAAAENGACDMGAACIGCSPKNADGSCPDAGPSGTCDCYKDGFRDGMNEFKECYETQPAPVQEPAIKQGWDVDTLLDKPAAQPAQTAQEPTCPECKAAVLYECVACSSNNYPPAAPVQTDWEAIAADQAMTIALLKSEAAAQPVQEPVAYAGVKVWVGNQQVVRLLTQTELHYAVEPWLLVELNAMKCVQDLKEFNT